MHNVDVWVFEDGSTDGTKDVIKKLKKEFGFACSDDPTAKDTPKP
jgi:cellulose synthase/poly-beta-1,6-N-acetylglucosamine synthase-like glycosyltransferase